MRFFGVLFFLFFLMDFSRWVCWKKPQKGDSFSFPTAPFWEGKLPKPVQKGGRFGSHNKINTKSTKLRIESNKNLTQIDSVSGRAAKLHLLYTCNGGFNFGVLNSPASYFRQYGEIPWNSLVLVLGCESDANLCFTWQGRCVSRFGWNLWRKKTKHHFSKKKVVVCVVLELPTHMFNYFFGEFPTETLFVGCLKVLKVNEHPETQESFFVAIASWFSMLVLVLLQATLKKDRLGTTSIEYYRLGWSPWPVTVTTRMIISVLSLVGDLNKSHAFATLNPEKGGLGRLPKFYSESP